MQSTFEVLQPKETNQNIEHRKCVKKHRKNTENLLK